MSNSSIIDFSPTTHNKTDKSRWISRIFHVNLSHAFEDETYWLHACGQRYELCEHTEETIAALRIDAPHLHQIPDHRLTHYTEEHVLLPHDRVTRIHIKHTMNTFECEIESGAFHALIHIPEKKFRPGFTLEDDPSDPPVAPPTGANPPPVGPHGVIDYEGTAKALIFHHADTVTHNPDVADIIFEYMDPEQSELIYSYISNSDLAPDGLPIGLADRMEAYGPPSPDADGKVGNGWVKMVESTVNQRRLNPDYNPATDPKEEKYLYDEDGDYIYNIPGNTGYDPNYPPKVYHKQSPVQPIMDYAGTVMTQMMIATKNDLRLQDQKWTQEAGTSTVSTDPNAPNPAPFLNVLGTVDLQGDDWNPSLDASGFHYGMKCEISNVNSDKHQIQVDISNHYMRYLGLYVSFLDAEGEKMDLDDTIINGKANQKWFPSDGNYEFIEETLGSDLDLETDTMRYVGMVGPINVALGIPIPPDGETTVYLQFPDNATKAVIYGCGLGTGENSFPKANVIGGVLTALINLTIPAFLMGFAVAAQSYSKLYKALEDSDIEDIVAGLMAFFSAEGSAENKQMDWGGLTDLTSYLFEKYCSKALEWCEQEMAEGEIEDEIPFSGWIMVVINIAAGIAQEAETIVEVASSPWHIDNTISATIDSTLTINPDPQHKAWPQGQAGDQYACVTKRIYKDNNRAVVTHTTNYTKTELDNDKTLVFDFPGNSLGGQVKFEADFYINNTLLGKASTGFMDNNETNAAEVTLYLVEIPKPLNSQSVYSHSSLLAYQNNQYDWMETAQAPQSTLHDLSSSNSGNSISEVIGLALSQRFAGIGISWKSFGTGLADVTTGANNTQLFGFQNINIPGINPMTDEKFTDYGFSDSSMLVYDNYAPKFLMDASHNWVLDSNGKPVPDPASISLGDYYLDPRKGQEDQDTNLDAGYHLRKVDITGTSNFDPSTNDQLSYGRFPYFPNHICFHPSGNVIGVSQLYSKVMILKLSKNGAADDALPFAKAFAGLAQNADREGLLFNPIAVSCTNDGTILILDSFTDQQGKSTTRIQAFDLLGRPVNVFYTEGTDPVTSGPNSPFLNLPSDVTYLDMVAVGNRKMTYMFVLYYEGDGSKVEDYKVSVYEYGEVPPENNPLVTTEGVSASRIQVDMWHTMYTLNYEMTTDGNGEAAGASGTNVGPKGRTVPSVSAWLPPVQ